MRYSTQNLLLPAALVLITGVYAVAENATLTALYPFSRGVYDQLNVGTNGEVRMRPDATIATAPVAPVTRPRIDIGLASIVGNCPRFSSYLYFDENPPATWRYTTNNNAGFVFGGCNNTLDFWTAPSAGAVAGNAVVPISRMTLTEGGNLGIGTTAPAQKLSVFGTGGNNVDLAVNGRIQTGDANNVGGVWLDGAQTMRIGAIDANTMGLWGSGIPGGWGLQMDNASSNIGIGTAPVPGAINESELDINGKLLVSGNASVAGTLAAGSFTMTSGKAVAKIMTSDANGVGTWQVPGAGPSNPPSLRGLSPHKKWAPGIPSGCNDPSPWVMCPVGQYVCGVRRQVIGGCGSIDQDTAAGPLCCSP